MRRQLGKRTIDTVVVSIGILLSAPVMMLVTLVIASLSKGNPFFVQERIGLYEKPFRLLKLKTMFPLANSRGAYLTRIGYWLRMYSIDELPQLWNVLRGEMSLVGPRPLLTEYLPHYNEEQRLRHTVKPGITGWAQIHGRNCLRWEEKFAYDQHYVAHQSLRLDLHILWLTAGQLLRPRHVRPEGLREEEKFRGSI